MIAELISIGDELLIGQTVNTNASWLGSELSLRGISVKWVSVVSDDVASIVNAFDLALSRSQLVIVTGGLGPTKDDITKNTLVDYFDTRLVINDEVLLRIEAYFKARGKESLEVNRMQAALPEACEVIHNLYGTACGMWFEKDGGVLVSLPGVPYEMKGMMIDEVFSKIRNRFNTRSLFHKTLLTTGLGESFLAEQIKGVEHRIYASGMKLAFLPSAGMVKLRITSVKGGEDAFLIDSFFKEISDLLPEHVFGYEDDSLASVVGDLLLRAGKTVGTVESCTGGGLGNALVSIPGSSSYFEGGLITYSYGLKAKLAFVSQETLDSFGAVSEEAVIEMARGGQSVLNVDYCISISGIAGPEGGTSDKPVGTVWMALAYEGRVDVKKLNLGGDRERNIQMTIFAGMNMLRLVLLLKNK